MAELMILVSILAVLMTIVLPKVNMLIRRANESATKGKVGALRSALQIYYSDMDGLYPEDLDPMLQPGSKYLSRIIPIYTFDHGSSEVVDVVPTVDGTGDTGGWGYVNNRGDGDWGHAWIVCTHTEMTGAVWSAY